MHAPVSVAASMMHSGLRSATTSSTSARTTRPSASVLWISIVVPLRAVTTSPSLYALPPVMFSTSPTAATTCTGIFSAAIAAMALSAAAAPAISHFMASIPSGVFRDRPPESKVTPLPTIAALGEVLSHPGPL